MKCRLFTLCSLLLLASCRQVVGVVNMKQLAPEIVEIGSTPGSWFEYMPAYAPHFCLKTSYSFVWHDPEMKLGYWQLIHPEPPHRIMMEARGDALYLHRGFVWDGVSFGKTEEWELLPSLLHDALYYARQGNAPVSRREADLVYLRACRRCGCRTPWTDYTGLRLFGGFFGKPEGVPAPLLRTRTPADLPAEPPEGESAFIELQL